MSDRKFRIAVFKEILSEYGKETPYGKMTSIAKQFGITRSAVSLWRKFGVPRNRVPYFRLKFPDLKVWEKYKTANF